MEEFESVAQSVEVASKADLPAVAAHILKSIQTGEIMNDPNMLLALGLFVSAGIVLFICTLVILFRRSGSDGINDSALFMLESRIQALEMAIGDQRNLAITMKNQNKADFGYYEQELKNLYSVIEEVEASVSGEAPRRLRTASNY